MEERKIWKTGKGSFVTTLPSEWAKNVKTGRIQVSKLKHGLFIMPKQAKEPIEATLKFDEEDSDMLRYEIITAYLNNYDELNVSFSKPKAKCIRSLESLPNKLLGLSVSFTSSNDFLVSMSTQYRPIPEILKQMLSQCQAIHETNQETLSTFKISDDEVERVKAIENDMDRLSFLAKRLFFAVLTQPDLASVVRISDIVEIPHWESLNSNLERIGDLQYEICLELQRLLDKFGKGISSKIHSTEANYGFRDYHKAAYAMVQCAYSNKRDDLAKIIRTKRDYHEEAGVKSREPFITIEQAKTIKKLINSTPDLTCLDFRIWGLTGGATNIAEAWLNMNGPSVV